MKGRRSGVSHTLMGQPPLPLVACRHAQPKAMRRKKPRKWENLTQFLHTHTHTPAQRSCRPYPRRASPLGRLWCRQSCRWGSSRCPRLRKTPSPWRGTNGTWSSPLTAGESHSKQTSAAVVSQHDNTGKYISIPSWNNNSEIEVQGGVLLPDKNIGLSSFFALSKASCPHGYLKQAGHSVTFTEKCLESHLKKRKRKKRRHNYQSTGLCACCSR